MSYDAFASEKDYFYNYSELRGLSRAVKGPMGNWKRIDAINSELKGLKGVSMVIHNEKLLVRHRDLPNDTPFVVFDKETLKPAEGEAAIKFKHSEEEDAKLQKLDWSDEKLPREDEGEEEEKNEDEEAKRPRRLIGATPLASDGKHIYALSMNIKKEEEDGPNEYPKMTLEVFEITEENVVKRTNEVTLKKDEENDWPWKPKKYNSDEGFFNHA